MTTTIPLDGSIDRRFNLRNARLFLLPILGNVVEYYDYALYGFCAKLFVTQFFPTDAPALALLKTFGVFLVGSLAKPLGALVFGTLGDQYGRKLALRVSMIGITLPTFCMGFMPTYQEIGWLAPLLLLICRALQGIFTAGESDGVRLFIYESLGKHRPYFANSLSGLSSLLGIYFASLAATVAVSFEGSYAWRIPFLFGGILGILVFLSRCYLQESREYQEYRDNAVIKPLESLNCVVRKNKRFIFATILLCGAAGGTYHFYMVFLGNYFSMALNRLDPATATYLTTQTVLIYTLCGPLSGLLADRFGAIRVMKFSLWGLFIAAILNIALFHETEIFSWLMGITAAFIACFQGPGFVVLFQKFKVSERYRCVSIGHALGSMLFSGSAPFVGFWIWQQSGIAVLPFVYFLILIGMGFLAVFLLNDRLYTSIPTE